MARPVENPVTRLIDRVAARVVDRVLVCLYVAAAALPALWMMTTERDVVLHGVVAEVAKPTLTWRTLRRETYQHDYTAWFERYLGLRGLSVFTDNAVLYHVFHETKPGLGTKLGPDGLLFPIDDIAYLGASKDQRPGPEAVDEYADKLARLQRRLQARGQVLVPVIIPAKTSLYRAEVPAGWRIDRGDPPLSDLRVYREYLRALDAHGLRYVDARALLTDPSLDRASVWGLEARHWSRYGACLTMRAVMQVDAALRRAAAVDYPCVMVMPPMPTGHVDLDLFGLINAWHVRPTSRRVPEVIGLAPAAATPAHKGKVLFVGTSFTDHLIQDAFRSGLFSAEHFFYYNVSYVEPWPAGPSREVAAHSEDWRRLVNGQDLIVVDLFEGFLDPHNYAGIFVDQMLAELDGTGRPAPAP